MLSTVHPGDDVRTTACTPSPARRVIDAPTRMFHWLFAACFVGAYLTANVVLAMLSLVVPIAASG